MARQTPASLALLLALALAVSANDGDKMKKEEPNYFDRVMSRLCISLPPLVCHLHPTANSTVRGRVTFEPLFREHGCAVRINASVSGLSAGAKQAIHAHNFGDLSLASGKSLGGHFAGPGGMKGEHGLPGSKKRHWGDFGSLAADKQGNASYSRVDRMISIPGIVGRGMVVHAGEDKGAEAQPSGGAGARKAMCVIGYANPDLL